MRASSVLRPSSLVLLISIAACGGGGGATSQPAKTTSATYDPASLKCAPADHVHSYDLHDQDGDDAMVPCAKSGKNDYAGLIHIETLADGVHITIRATDEQVNLGELGTDAKSRDAVIVYPKGPGTEAVEVPLAKTKDGYVGDKIITWDKLDNITDEGTKIDVAIFDHDQQGEQAEEMHVAVKVSAGMSCEKAFDANPQTMNMGKASGPDLTADQLGAPMKSSAYFAKCGLPDSSNAQICATVKQGKPIGVTVKVSPNDNKVAACIDHATRKLSFPVSPNADKVMQNF